MDDREDEELNKPLPGQMRYDELLFQETNEEEEEDKHTVAPGQLDLWSIEKPKENKPPKKEEKTKPPKEIEEKVIKENTKELEPPKTKILNRVTPKKAEEKESVKEAEEPTLSAEENILDEEETTTYETDKVENENNRKEERFMGNNTGFYGDGGSGILTKTLGEVLHDSMIPYTEMVVMDRALPRVEDGLKPVQRRILYSMLELGLSPDKPYRKSARIVGDCMGKYHPHGDSSVYDAMVRLSQDFVLRAPLVDGHGNFGSVDGDSAAAMRYTEARLTPLAMEMLRDLEKDTVRWGLNFDDTLKEPELLPGRFPNLLVNGTSGIAVGVATNIPPHNLGETIDGVVAYINNEKITLDEMMKIIKGPDFPTGGELILSGLRSAYETGKGKIIIRAKAKIEDVGDRQNLVITELPYQVNKSQLLQKIAELKEKEKDKYSDISEIRDESDRSGMRAVIKLKKGAKAKKIFDMLCKNTNLEVSFSINMVAIAGGKPRLMGLLDIISYYANFQREVIVRRTKFDLDVAKDRAHIIEGLLIAIKNIDAVIKIIKTSQSVGEAKTRLREKFNLSEKQAQAILDMRLARLVNLEVNKLEEELKELKAKIKELEAILGSKKLQYEVVKKEMLEIKKRYATPRRSFETSEEIVLKKADEVEEAKEYYVLISAGKTIKRVNMTNYSKSTRTIGDGSTLLDVITTKFKLKSTDNILIITEKGMCIKTTVDKIPECKWREKGAALKQIDKNVDIMDAPVAIVALPAQEIFIYTEQGNVKRSTGENMVVAKSYYQVIKLAENDKVIGAEADIKGTRILMFSKSGSCVNFEKSEVSVQGRIAAGVKGINIDAKDVVVFAGQSDFENATVVTDNGYIKKFAVSEIAPTGRNKKGLKYINFEGGKAVKFVGKEDKVAIDLGLKFKLVETKKLAVSKRLATGEQEVKGKILGVYPFED